MDTSPDGSAFGNGVLNFSIGSVVPEPTCALMLAPALLAFRRQRRPKGN
jgi:hypothetical protein